MQRLRNRLKDGFNDMVLIRAVGDIDVQGCTTMVHKSVKKFFGKFNIKITDFPVTQRCLKVEVRPSADI